MTGMHTHTVEVVPPSNPSTTSTPHWLAATAGNSCSKSQISPFLCLFITRTYSQWHPVCVWFGLKRERDKDRRRNGQEGQNTTEEESEFWITIRSPAEIQVERESRRYCLRQGRYKHAWRGIRTANEPNTTYELHYFWKYIFLFFKSQLPSSQTNENVSWFCFNSQPQPFTQWEILLHRIFWSFNF